MKLKSTVPAAIAATCLMTQPALAYQFSPTQIRSVISGKMYMHPHQCRPTLHLPGPNEFEDTRSNRTPGNSACKNERHRPLSRRVCFMIFRG